MTVSAIAIVVVALVYTAVPAHAAAFGAPAVEFQGHGAPPAHQHQAAKPPHTTHGKPAGAGASHGKSGASHGGAMTAADHLKKSPQLAQKLAGLLPAGTDLQAAAAGFKNFGQFVAAVHVSNNLKIPFDQLKALMIAPKNESLGQAIHELKPEAPADAVKTAETEAKADVKEADAEQKAAAAQAKAKAKAKTKTKDSDKK